MAPGERGVAAGYSGPWEQVHRQTNQKIQCGFRPRVGLASTRALLPLGAAPSLSPVQCCSRSYHSAWSKHSGSELARGKGPAFTGKRLH